MPALRGIAVHDVLPTCFSITAGIEDSEFHRFVKRFHELDSKSLGKERLPKKHCNDNWWLVKPANMNQGSVD